MKEDEHLEDNKKKLKESETSELLKSSVQKDKRRKSEREESPSRTYSCERCDKDFRSKSYLREPMEDRHSYLACRDCDQSFSHSDSLKKHKRRSHAYLACRDCDQ